MINEAQLALMESALRSQVVARYGHQFTFAVTKADWRPDYVDQEGKMGPGHAFYLRFGNPGLDKTCLLLIHDENLPWFWGNTAKALGPIFDTMDECLKTTGMPFLGAGESSN